MCLCLQFWRVVLPPLNFFKCLCQKVPNLLRENGGVPLEVMLEPIAVYDDAAATLRRNISQALVDVVSREFQRVEDELADLGAMVDASGPVHAISPSFVSEITKFRDSYRRFTTGVFHAMTPYLTAARDDSDGERLVNAHVVDQLETGGTAGQFSRVSVAARLHHYRAMCDQLEGMALQGMLPTGPTNATAVDEAMAVEYGHVVVSSAGHLARVLSFGLVRFAIVLSYVRPTFKLQDVGVPEPPVFNYRPILAFLKDNGLGGCDHPNTDAGVFIAFCDVTPISGVSAVQMVPSARGGRWPVDRTSVVLVSDGKVVDADFVPPSPPRNVRLATGVGAVTSTSVHLHWDAPLESSHTVTGYEVRYWEESQGVGESQSILVGPDVTAAVVADLRSSTRYHFQVRGFIQVKRRFVSAWSRRGRSEALVATTAREWPPTPVRSIDVLPASAMSVTPDGTYMVLSTTAMELYVFNLVDGGFVNKFGDTGRFDWGVPGSIVCTHRRGGTVLVADKNRNQV